ncbi:MAG: carbohydrate-binding family 9-like protein [Myxococcota bacterium]|jgi:hypothetical protein|nr:carbohydrate-binding family 9-like protein [Myxococcota bacterium]
MRGLPRPIWLFFCGAALAAVGCVPDDTPLELTPGQRERVAASLLTTLPTPAIPQHALFGDAVELLGLELSPRELAPGEPFTLTWYWRCRKELDRDYQVFVHLDSDTGGYRMNLDHHPVQGMHPIQHWKKGQIIKDVQQERLDGAFPAGAATLWVGVFLDDTRLPVAAGGPTTDGASRVKALGLSVLRKPKPARAGGENLPLLEARRATGPITVDGRLDEPAWQQAAFSGDFVLPGGEPGKPPQATQAAFLWNDGELLVGFRCEDEDVWTSLRKDDLDLWTEEVVELFLDPDGDGKNYVEIQVNPANALFDAFFPTYRSDLPTARAYGSRARHAVAIEGTLDRRDDRDTRWTVELAIPFDALPALPHTPPVPGDEWRVNLFRMDKPQGGRQQASAWSPPIVKDFHALNRFGRLRFTGEQPAAPQAPAPAPAAPMPAPVTP